MGLVVLAKALSIRGVVDLGATHFPKFQCTPNPHLPIQVKAKNFHIHECIYPLLEINYMLNLREISESKKESDFWKGPHRSHFRWAELLVCPLRQLSF